MYITEIIRLKIDDSLARDLDELSHRALRLYNKALEICLKGHSLELRSLLGLIYEIKRESREFAGINSDIIYSIAKRIKRVFSKTKEPTLKKEDRDWFSLYYDKNIKVYGKNIEIDVLDKKREIKLYTRIIKHQRIISYLIIKKANNYYLHVALEKRQESLLLTNKAIAIDPNHTNFFMAMDSEGVSYEMKNLALIVYFDKRICEVKKKRKQCQEGSNRYKHLSLVIDKLYQKRNEELKLALYTISNFLVKHYDKIAIGNYYPRFELATNEVMRYKMLKESVIGKFRDVLSYVALKYGKEVIKVDEKNTTAKCFNCGYYERKSPDIRMVECKCCHKIYNRDINSAINIGIKGHALSAQDYVDLDLSKPTYALEYSHTSGLVFKEIK